MGVRRRDASRLDQARVIVQARWSLAAPPPADAVEVGWLLASGEPLDVRHAAALARLAAEVDGFLSGAPREASGEALGRVARGGVSSGG